MMLMPAPMHAMPAHALRIACSIIIISLCIISAHHLSLRDTDSHPPVIFNEVSSLGYPRMSHIPLFAPPLILTIRHALPYPYPSSSPHPIPHLAHTSSRSRFPVHARLL
ncbi:hypothetical protein VTO73DRAFT_6881 [Trametes versicolor]